MRDRALYRLCNAEERAERRQALSDDFNPQEEMGGESLARVTTLRSSDPQSRKRRYKEELT